MKVLLSLCVVLASLMLIPVAHAADAVLTWQAPTVTGTNGAATGYRVYKGTGTAPCAATTVLPTALATLGNVLTFTDPNVPQGATICFEVSATNAGGEGIHSNRITLLVPTNPPGAPTLGAVIQ